MEEENKEVKKEIKEIKEVDIPIKDKVDKLWEASKKGKNKELRLSSKAKTKGAKLKKNFIAVFSIKENKSASFEQCQIEDSVYRTKDGTYHYLDGSEILLYKNRYPMVIQPLIKCNPLDLVTGKNETKGQKAILAKMIKDTIKVVKKGANGMIVIIVILLVLFALGKYVFKLF